MLVPSTSCAKQAPPPRVTENPVVVAQSVDVVEAARKNIGIPYKFGGTTPETGFDCSGLVCWSYAQVGVQVPRTARDQYKFGERVEKSELKPGDIVLFKGTRSRTGWHSGIYTGEGRFIHSLNKGKTVMESSLDETYFAKRFAGASRVPMDGSAATLYASYQDQQRQAANTRRTGNTTAKPGTKNATLADAGKNAKTTKNDATATARKTTGKATTPLRTAAANPRQPAAKQIDAIVDKLRAAARQAPATRTQARQSSRASARS